MEKASWHSLPFVISYITSSSVRSVGNIFTACVQGNLISLPYNQFSFFKMSLTESIKSVVFLALSRNPVISPSGYGAHTIKLTSDS